MPTKPALVEFLRDALGSQKYPNLSWMDDKCTSFGLNVMNKRNKHFRPEFERIYEDWDKMKTRGPKNADKIERFKSALKRSTFLEKCKATMNDDKILAFRFKDKAIVKAGNDGMLPPVRYGAFPVSSPECGYASGSSPDYQGHDNTTSLPIHNNAKLPERDSGYSSSPDSPGFESSAMQQQSDTYDVAGSTQETRQPEGDSIMEVVNECSSPDLSSLGNIENNASSTSYGGLQVQAKKVNEDTAIFGSNNIFLPPPNDSIGKLENGFMPLCLNSHSETSCYWKKHCVCSKSVKQLSAAGNVNEDTAIFGSNNIFLPPPNDSRFESPAMQQQSDTYNVADSTQGTRQPAGDSIKDYDLEEEKILNLFGSDELSFLDNIEDNASSPSHDGLEMQAKKGNENTAGLGSNNTTLPPNDSMSKLENGSMSPGLDSNSGTFHNGSGLYAYDKPAQQICAAGDKLCVIDLLSLHCIYCKKPAQDLMSGTFLHDGRYLRIEQRDGKTFLLLRRQ